MEPTCDPILLEPQGLKPFLIFLDSTLDDDSNSCADPIVDQYGNSIEFGEEQVWIPDLSLL